MHPSLDLFPNGLWFHFPLQRSARRGSKDDLAVPIMRARSAAGHDLFSGLTARETTVLTCRRPPGLPPEFVEAFLLVGVTDPTCYEAA
jgi:hypothetical protein